MRIYPRAKVYLTRFTMPSLEEFGVDDIRSLFYPGRVIVPKQLTSIDFAPITILYGSNGCGKSTLLNVIGRKIGCDGAAGATDSGYMADFVNRCQAIGNWRLIKDRIHSFRSETIAGNILSNRRTYSSIKREIKELSERDGYDLYERLFYSKPGVDVYEGLDPYTLAQLGHTRYFREMPDIWSNGETAIYYYEQQLEPVSLYLMDEPEASLSPVYQKRLVEFIERTAYSMEAQFIIATHSPFLLSIDQARIIDMDANPARITDDWTSLSNMQLQYNLFRRFADRFETNIKYGRRNNVQETIE